MTATSVVSPRFDEIELHPDDAVTAHTHFPPTEQVDARPGAGAVRHVLALGRRRILASRAPCSRFRFRVRRRFATQTAT